MHKEITFALTSCGRPDLLFKTLDSFLVKNTYPIKRFKIIDDSTIEGVNDILMRVFSKYNIEWIHNKERLGQSKSIDILYDDIITDFIFHCEDDWEFRKEGFIEESLKLLEEDEKILQVWLRGSNDTNGHPLIIGDKNYDTVSYNYQGVWHGFSFNPGLRRLNDYLLIKPYSKIGWETEINKAYKDMGYKAVTLKEKYIEHIGWDRHVRDAKHG